jgi:hypothetical protein
MNVKKYIRVDEQRRYARVVVAGPSESELRSSGSAKTRQLPPS